MGMRAPTSEEIAANAIVVINGETCMAAWYPQMGGYVSKCWVIIDPASGGDGCFGVAVWSDGEFPFREGRDPVLLHHCDPAQFIEFGNLVANAQKARAQANG